MLWISETFLGYRTIESLSWKIYTCNGRLTYREHKTELREGTKSTMKVKLANSMRVWALKFWIWISHRRNCVWEATRAPMYIYGRSILKLKSWNDLKHVFRKLDLNFANSQPRFKMFKVFLYLVVQDPRCHNKNRKISISRISYEEDIVLTFLNIPSLCLSSYFLS